MRYYHIGLFFLMLTTIGCGIFSSNKSSSSEKIGAIYFNKGGFTNILETAASSNKPIFVDYTATWCLPCKQMEKNVFTDLALANYLNDEFVCYKLDADSDDGKMLQAVFGMKMLPTLLFLDEEGELVYKTEGFTSAETLLRQGKKTLEQCCKVNN